MAEAAAPPQGVGARTTRRVLLAAAVSAAAGAGAPARAEPELPTFLETRLFNFRDDVSMDAAEGVVRRLRGYAASVGADGVTIGRNLNGTPFPTRFEWFYMVGRRPKPTDPDGVADAARALTAVLAPACASVVGCELLAPLPRGFGAAPGVGVRHAVMFDFKPSATSEARRRVVEAIRGMGRLSMVANYVVAPNPAFGSDPTQMEWQVIGDFASLTDYKAYADAPVHLSIRSDFQAATSRVAFIDVQV